MQRRELHELRKPTSKTPILVCGQCGGSHQGQILSFSPCFLGIVLNEDLTSETETKLSSRGEAISLAYHSRVAACLGPHEQMQPAPSRPISSAGLENVHVLWPVPVLQHGIFPHLREVMTC